MKLYKCECSDHACPVHPGIDCPGLLSREAAFRGTLYRVDMDDRTGTSFCASCFEDASESGLYQSAEEIEADEREDDYRRNA